MTPPDDDRSPYPSVAGRLSRVAERLYREDGARREDVPMPATVAALLESRGVDAGIDELVEATFEAVLAMPESRRPDPREELSGHELAVLEAGGFHLAPAAAAAAGPLAAAAARFAALIATSVTTAEAADRLGVNPSRIRQRLADRSLYGFKLGGDWRVPTFQLAEGGLVPGIERILPELPADLHPTAVLTWFTSPSPDLVDEDGVEPIAPLDWLRAGRDPRAVAAVAALL